MPIRLNQVLQRDAQILFNQHSQPIKIRARLQSCTLLHTLTYKESIFQLLKYHLLTKEVLGCCYWGIDGSKVI